MYTLTIKDRKDNIVSVVKGSQESIEALASLYISMGLDMGEDYDENVLMNSCNIVIKEDWFDDFETMTLNRRIKF